MMEEKPKTPDTIRVVYNNDSHNDFGHMGKIGDIIYSMSAAKEWLHRKAIRVGSEQRGTYHLSARDDKYNGHVALNPGIYDQIRPLMEAQDYIEKTVWNDFKVDHNFCGWYNWMKERRSMIGMYEATLGLGIGQWMYKPWLTFPDQGYHADWYNRHIGYQCYRPKATDVLINWTPRYQPWGFPWDEVLGLVGEYAQFAGLPEEYEEWSKLVSKPCPYAGEMSFTKAAWLVSECKLFVGTQSSLMAVAGGLRKPRIIAACPSLDNNHWGSPESLPVYVDTPITIQRINQLLEA